MQQAEAIMISHFDFSTNQTLDLERVINSAYANPDGRKFSKCNWNSHGLNLHPKQMDAKSLLKRIKEENLNAFTDFNNKQIKLYDTSNLNPSVDKQEWVAQMKDLRWYGPFIDDSFDTYVFQTADTSGKFRGVGIWIAFERSVRIYYQYFDASSKFCGNPLSFKRSYKAIPRSMPEMLKHFDFSKNENVKLENVIKAAYSNPNGLKFPKCSWNQKQHPLHPSKMEAEELIDRVREEISFGSKLFDHADVMLYATGHLYAGVNKESWLADLKTLKWYGPFKDPEHDTYVFQAASDSGKFQGVGMWIWFEGNRCIFFEYFDKDSDFCGESHQFKNLSLPDLTDCNLI